MNCLQLCTLVTSHLTVSTVQFTCLLVVGYSYLFIKLWPILLKNNNFGIHRKLFTITKCQTSFSYFKKKNHGTRFTFSWNSFTCSSYPVVSCPAGRGMLINTPINELLFHVNALRIFLKPCLSKNGPNMLIIYYLSFLFNSRYTMQLLKIAWDWLICKFL